MTTTNEALKAGTVDMKLEVAVIPVSDVDRAKRFYGDLGWRLDADHVRVDGSRGVQLTPPGSPASIQLESGPAARFYVIVTAVEAARAELAGRGVDVTGVTVIDHASATNQRLRIGLTYAAAGAGPASLFVKLASPDPAHREMIGASSIIDEPKKTAKPNNTAVNPTYIGLRVKV